MIERIYFTQKQASLEMGCCVNTLRKVLENKQKQV